MTTLREKMKEEMLLMGLAASTQAVYMKALVNLYHHYKQSPAELSAEQLRAYLLSLKKKSLAPNTYNVIIYALRFFYCVTLRQPLKRLELPTTKVSYKLPEILSTSDVQRILKATHNIKHKALLMTIYGSGLRVSEAVHLKMKDIDRSRMTLHLRHCKNNKDRYVILPQSVHDILRQYWKHSHFTEFVFPGQKAGRPITTSTASAIYQQAKAYAGVHKAGGIHALRHAFATHMLEAGEDLFVIKQLLGHASIQSTVRYLRFIPDKTSNVKSPIDQLDV